MKMFRRIFPILTAAALMCCACALAACGEAPAGEKVQYTVTVLDPTGAPLEGVTVKWSADTPDYKTLENGKATANLASGTYDVSLSGFDDWYRYEPARATAEDRDLTITLAWNPEEGNVVYSIKVVYPNGDPVENVDVSLCKMGIGGTCTPFPLPTDRNGVAYGIGEGLYGMIPDDYEGQILSELPAGYTYDVNEVQHYTGDSVSATKLSMTITLKAKTE